MRNLVAPALSIIALGVLAACTEGPGPSEGGIAPPLPEPTVVETTVPQQEESRDPVVVFGPEGVGADTGAVAQALARFTESSGIAIDYVVVADGNRELARQIAQDEPGDVFLIDSADLLIDNAIERSIRPLPQVVHTEVGREWAAAWLEPARFGELLFGVPVDASVESLIWFQPARFAAAGYEPPETWTGLVELANQMIADELTPFCGFRSEGEQTQAFIDWTFDLLLRSNELGVYDSVLSPNGDRSFDDPAVFDVWLAVRDLWVTPGVGFEVVPLPDDGSEPADPGSALISGECLMARSDPEIIDDLPEETTFADGSPTAVDVVVFPGPRGDQPMIANVTYAVSRSDNADVWAVMQYLGSSQFARHRRAAQADEIDRVPAFLSVAVDQDLFQLTLLELSLLDTTARTTGVRDRWDELMPRTTRLAALAEVRALLSEGRTVTDALDAISEP